VSPAIYRSDPDAAPDKAFEPGTLKHVVVGNRGRLFDARRTPVTITALAVQREAFELRIEAFEDAAARWSSREMNTRFHEPEAVLIGDPSSRAF
jgi:hypothetical protein